MKPLLSEVLLLGSGVTVLGALRCLSQVDVVARVAADEPFQYRRSRSYRSAPPIKSNLAEYLLSLQKETAVLIPCSDRLVREVAGLPQELKERFPSAIPPLAVLDQFLDKGLFLQLLEREGVPHPQTLIVDDSMEVARLDVSSRFFIKPCDSQSFHRHFGVKAFLAQSQEDLGKKLEITRQAGLEVMLQEYVPGPPSNHYFVDGFMDAGGEIPAIFARRRLRMHPPDFGNSSYMVTIPPEEVSQAVKDLARLLTAVRYRGVFSAEFKKDERDGVFRILEVNARPWWFVEFAANCGVNVVEMAYRDSLGQPVEEVGSYRVGRRFVHPYYDVSACLRESSSRVGGFFNFLGSLPGADQPVFRWSDPLPAFSEFRAVLGGFVRRRLGGASQP